MTLPSDQFGQGEYTSSFGGLPPKTVYNFNHADPSKWVSFALKDNDTFRAMMVALQKLHKAINEAFATIFDAFALIQAILETVQTILKLIDELLQMIIKAIIKILDEIRKAIIQLLEDILNLGFYIYPHFLYYDWAGAIAKELITPFGVNVKGSADGSYSIEGNPNAQELIAVPDFARSPGKMRYIFKTKSGGRGYGFPQFMADMELALTNQNDRWRPVFSAFMGVSGALVVLAIDNIFPLVRFLIELIDLMIPDRPIAYEMAVWLAKALGPKLAAANQFGFGDPDAIENARQFMFDVYSRNMESIFSGGLDPTVESEISIFLSANIVPTEDMDIAGEMVHFGWSPEQNEVVSTGGSSVFGGYRGNSVSLKLDGSGSNLKGSSIGVYVQRVVQGVPAYGDKNDSFRVATNNIFNSLRGIDRGCKIDEFTEGSGMESEFFFPIEGVAEIDPGVLAAGHFLGLQVSDPAATMDGDYYFNYGTGTIRRFEGGWSDVAKPDTFIISTWNLSTQLQVGQPLLIWVPRFALQDQSQQVTHQTYDNNIHRNVTRTDNVIYQYGDNFPLMASATVTFGQGGLSTLKDFYTNTKNFLTGSTDSLDTVAASVSKEYNVPINDVESTLGLPRSLGGGNGVVDFKDFDIFPGQSMPLTFRTKVYFKSGFFENNYLSIIYNGQRKVISGTIGDVVNIFNGMNNTNSGAAANMFTGTVAGGSGTGGVGGGGFSVKTLEFNQEEDYVLLQIDIDMSDGCNAVEFCSSGYKTVEPIGVTMGTYKEVQFQAYSRPITYRINRAHKTYGKVVVLSPKQINVGQADLSIDENISSIANGFKFPPQDFAGMIVGTDKDRLPATTASYRWRGSKPVSTGVIVFNETKSKIDLITPITDSRSWRSDYLFNYPAGTAQFSVYAYSDKFMEALGFGGMLGGGDSGFSGFWDETNKRMSKGPLGSESEFLMGPTDFVLEVSGDIVQSPGVEHSPWVLMNLKQWIDIVEPLDNLLKSLIAMIPIPGSIFDGLIALIEAIQLFISNIEKFIKRIQRYIDRLFRMFDTLARTGFYVLGMTSAAGTEGLLFRMKNAEVDPNLLQVPYVTGVALIMPDWAFGNKLIDLLFADLPTGKIEGEPKIGSFTDRFAGVAKAVQQAQQELIDTVSEAYSVNKQSLTDKTGRLTDHFKK
jgi:hypothetical protein